MTDFALPLPVAAKLITIPRWVARFARLMRVHARYNRRRGFREAASSGTGHDWLLALPQSRHGG